MPHPVSFRHDLAGIMWGNSDCSPPRIAIYKADPDLNNR